MSYIDGCKASQRITQVQVKLFEIWPPVLVPGARLEAGIPSLRAPQLVESAFVHKVCFMIKCLCQLLMSNKI